MSHDPHSRLHAEMHASADELLDLHRRLVQVPSINLGDGSSARETEVAEVAAGYLAQSGVKSRIVESAPGRGNLLAWIGQSEKTDDDGAAARSSGAPGRPTLLLMSHSDVVPPGDESSWRFGPFSAEVADGRVWGRGVNDCKMLAACELFAIAHLARLGLVNDVGLRLAIGADEEAGGRWGFGWLAENETAFMRADLAINEGGGAYLGRSSSGERVFTVATGEKGRYEVTLVARGRGTHASVPWGTPNPLVCLGGLAERISAWQGEVSVASPVFELVGEMLGMKNPVALGQVEEAIERARRFSKAFSNSLAAQSRVTIVPTVFGSGGKSNVVPASAELRCDARILPGQTVARLEEALAEILRDSPDVEVAIAETAAPSVSPFPEQVRRLFDRAVSRTLNGGVPAASEQLDDATENSSVIPTWCTGFTDSRFVRALGTPTYGFQFVEPNADPDRLSIHCVDESIEVGMLLPCAQSLGHLVVEFAESASERKAGVAGPEARESK